MVNQNTIKRKTAMPKRAAKSDVAPKAAREKKPMGRPPVGNYLTQVNVRVTKDTFEQIEQIKSFMGFVHDAETIRWALRDAAIRCGYQPKKPE
jgi:hypothetical protein